MQNPQLGARVANYPGLTSLWQRDDLQALVTDPTLTNALTAGASLGEIMNTPSVHDLLANKELSKQLWGTLTTKWMILPVICKPASRRNTPAKKSWAAGISMPA